MKFSLFWKGLVLVLVLVLLVGGVVFVNRIQAGDAFSKEEASHALYSLWLWKDLKVQDWGAFWYDTQRQMIWPFLHSWVQALFFMVFGVGFSSARLMSLIFFLLSAMLVYLLCNRFSEKDGPKIGMLSVALVLTSPLMLRFATQNMLEAMGAFLFLLAAYIYAVCEERKLTIYYILLAFILGISIYTNYLYAYLLIPAFMVVTLAKLGPILVEAIRLSRRGEKAAIPFIWWAFKKMIALLIILTLAGGWFSISFSRKILLLLSSIFRYSGGAEVKGFWQSLVYYPAVIIKDITFSPWLGLFLFLSLFLPLLAYHYKGLNKLYVYVWTVLLLLAMTVPTKAPQMVYIIVPFIFMIFSAAFFRVLDSMQEKGRRLLVMGVIFAPLLLYLPAAYALFFPYQPAENMIQVMDYFNRSVPEEASMAAPLNLQRLNSEVLQFYYRDREGTVLSDPQLSAEELFREGDYFLSVDLDEESFYRGEVLDDSLFRWNSWLHEKVMVGEAHPYSSRRFESVGLTARIYRKTPGF